MRLFRVVQQGYGEQSFRVVGDGPPGFFLVDSGSYLLTIDYIQDMGTRIAAQTHGKATEHKRSAVIEKLLREND